MTATTRVVAKMNELDGLAAPAEVWRVVEEYDTTAWIMAHQVDTLPISKEQHREFWRLKDEVDDLTWRAVLHDPRSLAEVDQRVRCLRRTTKGRECKALSMHGMTTCLTHATELETALGRAYDRLLMQTYVLLYKPRHGRMPSNRRRFTDADGLVSDVADSVQPVTSVASRLRSQEQMLD